MFMRTDALLVRVAVSVCVQVSLVCGLVAGQPRGDHLEQLESIAWESAGGRDGRENRWADLVALFEGVEAHRDAADAKVEELIDVDNPDWGDRLSLGFMFQMVGDIEYHEKNFVDPEMDYLGRDTPEERRALFSDAEAIYIDVLDGMDDAGFIGRLKFLRESGAAFVPVPDERTAMAYNRAFLDQLGEFRKLTLMLDRRMLLS
ncbi:MAG: hypothetical protein AAFN41_11455, partial [Planctomycetota bacterium]